MTWLSGHPGLLPSTNTHAETHTHIRTHTHLYSCTISSSFFPLYSIHSYFLSVLCQGRKQLMPAWMAESEDEWIVWQRKKGVRISLCAFLQRKKPVAYNCNFPFSTCHNFVLIVSLFHVYRWQGKYVHGGLKHTNHIFMLENLLHQCGIQNELQAQPNVCYGYETAWKHISSC